MARTNINLPSGGRIDLDYLESIDELGSYLQSEKIISHKLQD